MNLKTHVFRIICIGAFIWCLPVAGIAVGQQTNTQVQIQLPTTSFFDIRTVVSAPDAGFMRLGGVYRSGEGRNSRGIPGLANVPFVNRPFHDLGLGSFNSASQAAVRPIIIINKEIEADLLNEADRRESMRISTDPNGSQSVQHKADFLSRNIGRGKR